MKTMHLATGHVAHDTRVYWKEARTLADAGHEVVVVGLQDGSRGDQTDVEVVQLSRPSHRLVRFARNPIVGLALALRHRGDVVHLHDIEMLPVGLLLSFLGRKIIWDSHEDYPRLALDRPWIPSPLRPVISLSVAGLERLAVRRFSAVISAEEEGAKRFPPDRTVVVRNYVLAEELATGDEGLESEGSSTTPSVVYVGTITAERGVREMVSAVDLLNYHTPTRLVILGAFSDEVLRRDLEQTAGWVHVDHRGFQPRHEVWRHLRLAKVGLLIWHPTRKHAEGAVPVKLFEYMAAGLPVVASDLPVIRSIVERCGAGLLVDPQEPAAIAEAIQWLLEHPDEAQAMGERGRRAVLEHYTWDTQAEVLLGVYASMSS